MKSFRSISGLAISALFLGLVAVTSSAQADQPPEHYANHPIHVRSDVATATPEGLSPDTVKSVYGFPTGSTAGDGKTIAIVDAFDDPNAEADLGTFSARFGLSECTTTNKCFTKVDQKGGMKYPRTDAGWALEISLDIQWAHAIAPGAHILLVEAKSNSFTNLFTAVDYAKANADYVSMSWGAPEFYGETFYDSHFVQTGVSFFVSSGDDGTPAEYPSSSPNVISVGGTTLIFNANGTFADEHGWSGSGGGCSLYESATNAQRNLSGPHGYDQVHCDTNMRATPDVSLVADPNSGVSVYLSITYRGKTIAGWFVVGGTSASTPMWAARSAVAGVTVDSDYVYGSAITFRDITTGNNGALCRIGYDLVTGRGSWTG